jgi:hypothetical protein
LDTSDIEVAKIWSKWTTFLLMIIPPHTIKEDFRVHNHNFKEAKKSIISLTYTTTHGSQKFENPYGHFYNY